MSIKKEPYGPRVRYVYRNINGVMYYATGLEYAHGNQLQRFSINHAKGEKVLKALLHEARLKSIYLHKRDAKLKKYLEKNNDWY